MMKPFSRRLLLLSAITASLASGTVIAAEQPLPVVASFSILGDVARQIGGERVRVKTLVGADADSHVYRATPSDIRTIRAAKVVLLNGLGFETASITRAVSDSKVPSFVATEGITPITTDGAQATHTHDAHIHSHEHAHDHEHEHHHSHAHTGHEEGHGHHHHGGTDPHVWHDPVRMQQYAANIAQALIRVDPAGKAHYSARLAQYQSSLKALDGWISQQLQAIPAAQRKVLTGHDSFAYLGQRYHIQFLAPLGTSTEGDASAKTVARLVQQIRTNNIRAVFVENIRDPRLVQQLGREAGVRVQTTPLYSDALSQPGGASPTYLELMRHNISQMVRAMQPVPPSQ